MFRFNRSVWFCLFAITAYTHAQNTFPATGNVGIGATNPGAALQLGSLVNSTTHFNLVFPEYDSTASVPVLIFNQPQGTYFPAIGYDKNVAGMILGEASSVYSSAIWQRESMFIAESGNVGIGTTSPAYSLDVTGKVRSTAGVVYPDATLQTTAWTGVLCGGDYAESVDVSGARDHYGPGDVMVVDPGKPGSFLRANEPYSTLVSGIYSTKPGAIGRRSVDSSKAKDEIPMAMIGIVPTKVSAENGPVKPGDLLVSSSTPGYAMRGSDRSRMTGAIVGKALGSVQKDKGTIEVLVTLQ